MAYARMPSLGAAAAVDQWLIIVGSVIFMFQSLCVRLWNSMEVHTNVLLMLLHHVGFVMKKDCHG